MMKRVAFICLILATSCSENQELDELESQWTVLWTVANEEIRGDLVLFNNNYAQLQVKGEPSSLLVQQPEGVNFLWNINDNQLTLRRLDNNIELKYDILKKSQDYMELSYADEISVKLYRH